MADGRRRGGGLAARFRAAVQGEERQRRKREADEKRRQEEAQAARVALLGELGAFAEEIGFIKVRKNRDGSLSFKFGDRMCHFEPQGDHDVIAVRIEALEAEEHRLYRESALDDRWVWSRKRGRREDRLPLWDTGLEELMVLALDLPRPGDLRELPDNADRKL